MVESVVEPCGGFTLIETWYSRQMKYGEFSPSEKSTLARYVKTAATTGLLAQKYAQQ